MVAKMERMCGRGKEELAGEVDRFCRLGRTTEDTQDMEVTGASAGCVWCLIVLEAGGRLRFTARQTAHTVQHVQHTRHTRHTQHTQHRCAVTGAGWGHRGPGTLALQWLAGQSNLSGVVRGGLKQGQVGRCGRIWRINDGRPAA